MSGRWASFEREFQSTKKQLRFVSSQFEEEVRLADAQEHSKRHQEILSKISSLTTSRTVSHQDAITNVKLPRNERFVGRDSTLTLVHSMLEPNFQQATAGRARSSVHVHGVGGMGKTEIALEYTYRYAQCYSHIFWLRSESHPVLLESFLEIVRKLKLEEKGTDSVKNIQIGLEWLQSSSKCIEETS